MLRGTWLYGIYDAAFIGQALERGCLTRRAPSLLVGESRSYSKETKLGVAGREGAQKKCVRQTAKRSIVV